MIKWIIKFWKWLFKSRKKSSSITFTTSTGQSEKKPKKVYINSKYFKKRYQSPIGSYTKAPSH